MLLNVNQKWKRLKKGNNNVSNSDTSNSDASDIRVYDLTDKEYQFIDRLNASLLTHLADILYTPSSVLFVWKLVIFVEIEKVFENVWNTLCEKFEKQQAILAYLYNTYMPLHTQWARCFIRKHRNFGIRVTSGTEASNGTIKSYLLNSIGHLYKFIETIEDILDD